MFGANLTWVLARATCDLHTSMVWYGDTYVHRDVGHMHRGRCLHTCSLKHNNINTQRDGLRDWHSTGPVLSLRLNAALPIGSNHRYLIWFDLIWYFRLIRRSAVCKIRVCMVGKKPCWVKPKPSGHVVRVKSTAAMAKLKVFEIRRAA